MRILGVLAVLVTVGLLTVGVAQAQSRPVIETQQPVYPKQSGPVSAEGGTEKDSRLGVLVELDDFDGLGLSDRPSSPATNQALRTPEIIEEAIAFGAIEGSFNALGYLASSGNVEESCSMFGELIEIADRHRQDDAVIIEGIKAGLISLDVGQHASYVTKSGGWEYVHVMGRESAMETIAAHPAVSSWLRAAARGQLLFERRLEMERNLLWQLQDLCTKPTDSFQFQSYGAAGCEPGKGKEYFVEQSLFIGADVFDFLRRVGVRDIELSCATIEPKFSGRTLGNVVLEGVAFRTLAASNARFESLRIERSVALNWVDLNTISVARNLNFNNFVVEGTLGMSRTIVSGAAFFVDFEAMRGLTLSHSTIEGQLYFERSSFLPHLGDTKRPESLDLYATSVGTLVIVDSKAANFTDARFLSSNGEVYIRGSKFGGTEDPELSQGLTLFGAQVREQLRILGTDIVGSANIEGTSLQEVLISETTISDSLWMGRSEVVSSITISDSEIEVSTNFAAITTGGEVAILRSKLGKEETQNTKLTLSDADIGASLVLRDVEVIGGIAIEAAELSALNLQTTKVTGGMNISKVRISRGIHITELEAASANFSLMSNEGATYIANSIFGDPSPENANLAGVVLNFYGVTLERTFWLKDSDVHGSANFSAGIFESLLLQSSVIAQSLYLTDARLGAVRLGEGGGVVIGGTLEMRSFVTQHFLMLNSVVGENLTAPNATFGSAVSFIGVDVHGKVDLRRAVSRSVAIVGLRATVISASGLTVENNIEFDRVSAREFFLDGVSANYLALNSELSGVPADEPVLDTDAACGIEDAGALPTPTVETAPDLIAFATLLGKEGDRCLDRLRAVGANIAGNLDIGGKVTTLVEASSANIGGQFTLAGAHTRYGNDACVIARNVRVDTIIYDLLDASGQASNPHAPAVVDVYGADFRMISASQPRITTRPRNDDGKNYLRAFLGDASACGIGSASTGAGDYKPAIYDALAAGQERAGNLDLARRIKVLKNQAYAETLTAQDNPLDQATVILTRAVYWMADVISGYGYDNLKAVIWLIAVTLVGFVLGGLGEERVAWMLDPIFRNRAWRQKRAEQAVLSAQAAAAEVVDGAALDPNVVAPIPKPVPIMFTPSRPRRAQFFFVLDRSVPSLSLDEAFARHEGLGVYLSTWFYVQRIICFLILLLMVAGAFNVFQ